MNTFGRALYLLVVEAVLLPFQLLALVGFGDGTDRPFIVK